MKELLLKALERMDAAAIKYKAYNTLDTTDLRQELQQLEIYEKVMGEPSLGPHEEAWINEQLTDTLTNSQITAECIKAGITDPEDIQWVQYNAGDVPKLEKVTAQELIQYLLAQKKQ